MPVRVEVVAALARAWLSVPLALLRRLVKLVMPLFAASSVRCPILMPSSRVLRVLTLVWNEFAKKKLVGLSSAELTFLPVASWF